MNRYHIKYLQSKQYYVLHIKTKRGWRRLWGYAFATESQSRIFAEGNF